MLPVSGALQLNASGPIGERPMISQRGAYSRLLSEAPYSDSGRKRFHSSCARAFCFRSSMTRVGTQGFPFRRFSCTSAKNLSSAG